MSSGSKLDNHDTNGCDNNYSRDVTCYSSYVIDKCYSRADSWHDDGLLMSGTQDTRTLCLIALHVLRASKRNELHSLADSIESAQCIYMYMKPLPLVPQAWKTADAQLS